MKKNLPVGTTATFDGIPVIVTGNRKTIPDLRSLYDYTAEIDFGDGVVEWGFAAKELDIAPANLLQ